MGLTATEPVELRLGQVVSFYKGKGDSSMAACYRSILLSNTILKLYHAHVRSKAKNIIFSTLSEEQCGGRPGVGTDFAC
eukprot:7740997-Pyramimonas_sp.AAC.1